VSEVGGVRSQVQTPLKKVKKEKEALEAAKRDLQCHLEEAHSKAEVELTAGAQ